MLTTIKEHIDIPITKEIINYHFTTDSTVTAEQAIPLIAARWSIETTFKTLKNILHSMTGK